jgi:hypothetical protein
MILCSTERRKGRSRKETTILSDKRNYILFFERENINWFCERVKKKKIEERGTGFVKRL